MAAADGLRATGQRDVDGAGRAFGQYAGLSEGGPERLDALLQRIRVLATSGEERSPFLKDVPNFREAGYDIVGSGWYAMYAPAQTPVAMRERLSRTIAAAAADRLVKERALALGMVPTGTSSEKLREIQKADFELWGPVVKASGFKPREK